jgi:Glycosyl transferase family 2
MSTQPTRIRGLLVVVPARDEEQLLGRCLAAINLAMDSLRTKHRDLATAVLVVADRCVDSTADIAREAGAHVLEIEAGCVGTARRAGVGAGIALLPSGPSHQTWVASTDADSQVPATWLEHQIDLASSGTRLIIGRATPDRDDLTEATWARWHRRHTSLDIDAHIHGANLGFRLDDYLATGGWPRLPQHEDQHLVNALLAAGVRAAPGLDVITSGRLRGRVPGGFSGYLRKIEGTEPASEAM